MIASTCHSRRVFFGVVLGLLFPIAATVAAPGSAPPSACPSLRIEDREPLLILPPDDPSQTCIAATGLTQSKLHAVQRGPNSVRLTVSTGDEAGSTASFIDLLFDQHTVRLMSPSGGFTPGARLLYDLTPLSAYFDTFPSDCWDSLTLVYDDPDTLILSGIEVIRNGSRILAYSGEILLEGSGVSRRCFASEILITKQASCPGAPNGIAWHAFNELGKDDGEKYSPEFPGGWCSEFASWVMRRNGWNTPQGSIGSRHMREFFLEYDRLFTIDQVYSGEYTPAMGDYLSMWMGGHSGLFLSFVDPDAPIEPSSRIITIEGGGVVSVYERTLADIDHVGRAQ